MTFEELEDWQAVQYRMREEGIDYCFLHYSDFSEIKDKEFHKLREKFIKVTNELQKYVDDKCNEEPEYE